jgi:hypothetical protein
MTLKLISGTYYLWRRVPKRYASVESRPHLKVTLRTDSEKDAKEKAAAVWQATVEAWEAKLAGASDDAEAQFEAARDLARAKGFRYVPAHKFHKLPLLEVVMRVEAVTFRNDKPDMAEARALLGAIPEPKITVERALEIYWKIADEDTIDKSPDQIRRWKNPRIKAVRNFVAVCGDLALDDISADDMLNFKDWWLDRIRSGDVTRASANKDLVHLGTVLKRVNVAKRLGISLPLSDLAFSGAATGQRDAFSEAWISDRIVGSARLGGLNTEARCIMLGMINTGYRPSEGASLGPAQIRLDADVPHISIAPNGRELKTQHSERVIPLAGISLEAFRE